tara:strand:- start:1039 stop:2442 length:1404 start_codon:yes stop_codon:yes gene_type:complete
MPLTFPIPNTSNQSGTPTNPTTYYGGATSNYGEFQYVALDEIVDNFMATYVGEGRILPKGVLRGDANFHAHRALQELSYDTLKSCKSLEVEVCPNLKVPLPHDYVNYTKITTVDSNGIERIIYPTRHTSNPFAVEQDDTECTDCNDTSATYQTDGINLKAQTEECTAGDIVCSFTNPASFGETQWDSYFGTDLLGAIHVWNQMQVNSGYFGQTEQEIYWQLWAGQVDKYCLCLQETGADDNCGVQGDWTNFIASALSATSVGQITGYMNNLAGWSNLQFMASPNPVLNVSTALNGTWQSIATSVTSSVQASNTWSNYSSASSNQVTIDQSTSTNLAVDNDNYFQNTGQRYGIQPEHAQANGSFFIDCARGMIHFSSNLSGKTIIIHYLSDGHAIEGEEIVHKFAEEAMYKWIAYGCLISRADTPEYVIQRFKKEKFAETRKAKIRLSNIKIEEISQIMRNKSKWIKK